MNSICEKIQNTLAEEGPEAIRRDTAAQDHLAECTDCFAFLKCLSEVEAGLGEIPYVDAPDAVVDALLARPEIAGGPAPVTPDVTSDPRWSRFLSAVASLLKPRTFVWASGAAAAVVLVVAVSLNQRKELGFAPVGDVIANSEQAGQGKVGDGWAPDLEPEEQTIDAESRERLQALGYIGGETDGRKGGVRGKEDAETIRRLEVDRENSDKKSKNEELGNLRRDPRQQVGVTSEIDAIDPDGTESSSRLSDANIADLPVPGRFYEKVLKMAPGVQDTDGDGDPVVHGSRQRDFQAEVSGVSNVDPQTGEYRESAATGPESAPTTIDESTGNQEQSRFDGEAEGKAGFKSKPKPVKDNATQFAGVGGVGTPHLIESSYVAPKYPELARVARIEGTVHLQALVLADGTVGEVTVIECSRLNLGLEAAATEAVKQWRYTPAMQNGRPVDVYFTIQLDFRLDAEQGALNPALQPALAAARAFLAERDNMDGLQFRPATGYWSNTYVPGDPSMRLLQARLVDSGLQAHDYARPAGQPFDAPDNSALAVYLHTDRRGIADDGRFLVQVGLQGTTRHGGRRPAMNLGVVLDMRGEITNDIAIAIRSLLDALNQAKEPGDRFRVVVAGRPGATVIDPENFRHGFLKVTMDRLLTGRDADGRPTLDIVEATAAAIRDTAASDDPATPLGSSAVVLITAGDIGAAATTLSDMAHQSAVAGVPLSVVGIGSNVSLPQMDSLALAGQGNRRLLESPARAAELVDRELSAASRAVARAVRLRIRLAPGVKLIDVVGSERLDETRAQRVRDAEKSIDLRLSRNLGIEADRGEDEAGIQVVIPSFYAGDSHVILLDVTASGPGPIADVTVRYKDLVQLRNGVGRASLSLDSELRAAGPLERNVLKNLLSLRLSETLDRAGRAVAAGNPQRARDLLERCGNLLTGLRLELPGLDNDVDLTSDIAMLNEYGALLADAIATPHYAMTPLSDSLRYAALLKVLPRPLEIRS